MVLTTQRRTVAVQRCMGYMTAAAAAAAERERRGRTGRYTAERPELLSARRERVPSSLFPGEQ